MNDRRRVRNQDGFFDFEQEAKKITCVAETISNKMAKAVAVFVCLMYPLNPLFS